MDNLSVSRTPTQPFDFFQGKPSNWPFCQSPNFKLLPASLRSADLHFNLLPSLIARASPPPLVGRRIPTSSLTSLVEPSLRSGFPASSRLMSKVRIRRILMYYLSHSPCPTPTSPRDISPRSRQDSSRDLLGLIPASASGRPTSLRSGGFQPPPQFWERQF